MERYYPNNISENAINIQEARRSIQLEMDELLDQLESEYPPFADYRLSSLDKKQSDYSIYVGTGGNLYTYWRLAQSTPRFKRHQNSALQSSLLLIEQAEPRKVPPSFLMGPSGVHALRAVIEQNLEAAEMILADQKFTKYKEAQDELLYGNAGYLYSLNFVLEYWPDIPIRHKLVQALRETVAELVRVGDNYGLLQYTFPRGQKRYLGAAHGEIGIYNMLMISRKHIGKNIDHILRRSLTYFLTHQLPSGNFPVFEGDVNDYLVHFCHGAPGAVPMLCLAYEAFGEIMYLESAIKCGNLIWERGLIKKGKGICHGISGNTFPFLTLYRVTQDILWYKRALAFALSMINDIELNQSIASTEDSQRMKKGVPDHPYSLMEGIAGLILLYDSCLNIEKSGYPCLEL